MTKMEYLSSIVFHTVILKMLSKVARIKFLRFYIENKVGVSIIDSIPHFHTEFALKIGKIEKCGFISI